MHSLQVSDSVVKSAGELHKHLSDEEIQEGRKIMDEENNKRLQSVQLAVVYYILYVCLLSDLITMLLMHYLSCVRALNCKYYVYVHMYECMI